MKSSILIKFAESEDELKQILKLQSSNLMQNVSVEAKRSDGFVTVKHDLDLLTKMNYAAGQIVAVDNDIVVGYALVMLKEFREMIPVLSPMFEMFNKLSFKRKRLSDYSFYVMGQICISENYRGKGIFEKLYLLHKKAYSHMFDICVTEVSSKNTRSMRAHQKIGFQTIYSFEDMTDNWHILVWDWNN
jgi:ribosomal protein S18 acetylase RimI-like enzyme